MASIGLGGVSMAQCAVTSMASPVAGLPMGTFALIFAWLASRQATSEENTIIMIKNAWMISVLSLICHGGLVLVLLYFGAQGKP